MSNKEYGLLYVYIYTGRKIGGVIRTKYTVSRPLPPKKNRSSAE